MRTKKEKKSKRYISKTNMGKKRKKQNRTKPNQNKSRNLYVVVWKQMHAFHIHFKSQLVNDLVRVYMLFHASTHFSDEIATTKQHTQIPLRPGARPLQSSRVRGCRPNCHRIDSWFSCVWQRNLTTLPSTFRTWRRVVEQERHCRSPAMRGQ